MISPSAITGRRVYKYCRFPGWFPIVTVLLYWATAGIASLWAGEIQTALSTPNNSSQISVLDGKSFAGELGLLGEPALTTDLLVFSDGMFVSKNCESKCGYTKGIYWVRAIEDGVEVLSETPCLRSDATIVWRGIVKGDKIEGTFTWTSERWYWTIEKEFWFNGKLVESDAPVSE
jgi:hypothetical protein